VSNFDRDTLREYMEKFLVEYGDETEVFDLNVYFKVFESSYFGKPLLFSSIAANTAYGLVSVNAIDWGLKKSLKASLKSLILEVNKLAEKNIYGEYVEASI